MLKHLQSNIITFPPQFLTLFYPFSADQDRWSNHQLIFSEPLCSIYGQYSSNSLSQFWSPWAPILFVLNPDLKNEGFYRGPSKIRGQMRENTAVNMTDLALMEYSGLQNAFYVL